MKSKWHVTHVTDTIAERKVQIPKISKASVCVNNWTYLDFKVDRGIVNHNGASDNGCGKSNPENHLPEEKDYPQLSVAYN